MRGVWISLVIASACASPRPKELKVDSAEDCPSGGPCHDHDICAYPGGGCFCASPAYCGGIDPGPNYQPGPPVWQCSPDPGTVRDDGCPGTKPTGACDQDGQTCAYQDGCCDLSMQCELGQWAMIAHNCPA